MSSTPQYPFPPLEPLQYDSPVNRQPRPGILTAVGVMSIIVAGLSGLASLSGIATGFMYMAMSNGTFGGQVANAPVAIAPAASATTTTTIPAGNTVPATTQPMAAQANAVQVQFRIDHRASALTIGESVLSLLVGILLLVAGIKMLGDARSAFKLHRIYILVKIPLIVVAAFATWWTYTGLMNSVTANQPGAAQQPFGNFFMIIPAAMGALFALAYPVALMIVFSTRRIKNYLEYLRTGQMQ